MIETRLPADPLPLDEEYRRLYARIAQRDVESPIQSTQALAQRAEVDLTRILALRPGSANLSLLEVGPGLGHFYAHARKAFGNVTVTDLVPHYLTRIEGARRVVADVQDLPFDGEFDVIVMCDVLEHVLRPSDALLSAARALRDGGLLYVRSPYREESLQYARLLGCPYPAVHLRTFTKATLRRELVFSGFSPVKTWFSHLEPNPYRLRFAPTGLEVRIAARQRRAIRAATTDAQPMARPPAVTTARSLFRNVPGPVRKMASKVLCLPFEIAIGADKA
jgi:SAM-dependent methyltransferase